MINTDKKNLRREFLSLRKTIKASVLSYNELLQNEHFRKAKTVFCYVSAKGEVDTHSLLERIAAEKTLTVPYCMDDYGNMICVKISSLSDLTCGRFGILEPKNPIPFNKKEIDFVIVPGVAFDKEGYRIGYGKGYYDRFLQDISPYKLGVCQKEFYVDSLPHDEYDIKMDKIMAV